MKTTTLILSLVLANELFAQRAGDLDSTFGVNGLLRIDYYSLETTDEYASSVGITPDGKIVIAGNFEWQQSGSFALAQFNASGPPNNTEISLFSDLDGDSNIEEFESANSLAIQSDGKIILAGTTGIGSVFSDFAVVRCQANGWIDSSFGNAGIVITDLGSDDWAGDMALQTDGKIIVAGASATNFALARYDKDGSV